MKLNLITMAFLYFLTANIGCYAKTIEVRTLILDDTAMPKVFLKNENKYNPLKWSFFQPNKVTKSKNINPMPLYKKSVDEDQLESFVIFHKIKIPTNSKQILLLGWKSKYQTQEVFKYRAINDNFENATSRDWILINVGSKKVTFRVGKESKPVIIAPGKSRNYQIASSINNSATITAAYRSKEKLKFFYSTYWPIRDNSRSIIIFFNNGKQMGIKRISDKLSAK